MPRRALRLALGLALAAFLAWGAGVAALLLNRHALIYPFAPGFDAARPAEALPGAALLRLTAADGTPLLAWSLPPADPARPTVIHFTGNRGDLRASAPLLAEFAAAGLGVTALVYRGAGGAPGAPSEAALTADALALHDAVAAALPPGAPAPVAHGVSLGAAVAAALAARRPVAGLVLVAPFARLCEAAEAAYPWAPACRLLPDERWDTRAALPAIRTPILVQHGDADAVIPLAQGERLAAAAAADLIVYPGGGHDDLLAHGAGRDALAFIAALPASQAPPAALGTRP